MIDVPGLFTVDVTLCLLAVQTYIVSYTEVLPHHRVRTVLVQLKYKHTNINTGLCACMYEIVYIMTFHFSFSQPYFQKGKKAKPAFLKSNVLISSNCFMNPITDYNKSKLMMQYTKDWFNKHECTVKHI